jgi:hypothetical protein
MVGLMPSSISVIITPVNQGGVVLGKAEVSSDLGVARTQRIEIEKALDTLKMYGLISAHSVTLEARRD